MYKNVSFEASVCICSIKVFVCFLTVNYSVALTVVHLKPLHCLLFILRASPTSIAAKATASWLACVVTMETSPQLRSRRETKHPPINKLPE